MGGKILVLLCLVALSWSYSWVDGPVEKRRTKDLHCPGLYCGRTDVKDDPSLYSECGKCPRGSRVSNNTHSICTVCDENPTIYDWLFLAFHMVLVLVLHWMAIDLTAKRQKLTQAVLTLHVCAALEVTLASIGNYSGPNLAVIDT